MSNPVKQPAGGAGVKLTGGLEISSKGTFRFTGDTGTPDPKALQRAAMLLKKLMAKGRTMGMPGTEVKPNIAGMIRQAQSNPAG